LWAVLVNLAAIAVVLAMLHAAHSQFETIVICALILVYTAVLGSFSVLGRGVAHVGRMQLVHSIELAKLRNEHSGLLSESLKEVDEETEKAQVKFWINTISTGIIGLIGTIALLLAVV
jgi:hypothetical protein